MVDIKKTKENLIKIFGDNTDRKIKETMQKEGCNETIAIFRLGKTTKDVEVPITNVIGVFAPKKISDIKEKVLDDVQELIDAEVNEKKIDPEMKQKGRWYGITAMSLGLFGKETTYVSEGVTDIQRKVGLADPTGYVEGTIWKEVNISKLAPLLPRGKVVGLNSLVTTYYHPHKKVGVNLNKKTEVIEVEDKVNREWLINHDEIEEYGVGFIEVFGVSKPLVKKTRGCDDPNCTEAWGKTKATICKKCAKETVELVTRTYGVECDGLAPDVSVPPWADFTLKEGASYVLAVKRADYNAQKQFTIVAIVSDFDNTPIGEVSKTVDTKSEVPVKQVKKKVEKKVEKKADTPDVEVSKKDLVRIRQMINSMTIVQESQLIGIAKTMELRTDENVAAKVLAKGLDTLEETVKDGSTWKLKSS